MKKLFLIFILAFAANLIWENLHSTLYLNYRGGEITQWILIRATFWDAAIITALWVITLLLPLKARPWFMTIGGLVIAIWMEKWALATARWAYSPAMPLLPILHTGLTPTIQLAFLGLLTYFLVERAAKL